MKIEFDEIVKNRKEISVPQYRELLRTITSKITIGNEYLVDKKSTKKIDDLILKTIPDMVKDVSYVHPGAFSSVRLTIPEIVAMERANLFSNMEFGSIIDKSKEYMSILQILGSEKVQGLTENKTRNIWVYNPTVQHLFTYIAESFKLKDGKIGPRDLFFFAPVGLNITANMKKETKVVPEVLAAYELRAFSHMDVEDCSIADGYDTSHTFSRAKYLKLVQTAIAMVSLKNALDSHPDKDLDFILAKAICS
jgi:hypothetical protein